MRTHSGSPPVRSAISNNVIETAVVRLVRAAVSAREELSARSIRQALEAEFACDLSAKKDIIVRAIQTTLENGLPKSGHVKLEIKDPSVKSETKQTKLPNMPQSLPLHQRIHPGERPFACDECAFRSSTRSDLIVHKRIHSGERPYACDECDYRCTQTAHLTRHKRVHSGERPFACDKCNYRFAQSSDLTRHQHVHASELVKREIKESKVKSENERAHLSKSPQTISVHAHPNSGELSFACDQCDYRTSIINNLIRHKRVHSGERPFACDQCDYRSSSSDGLYRHAFSHSAACSLNSTVSSKVLKNAVTRLVRAAASAREELSARRIRLTLELEFACDLSAKKDLIVRAIQAALESKLLPTHEPVKREIEVKSEFKRRRLSSTQDAADHSGERLFACDECDFRSAKEWNISQHKRVHSVERPYACAECNYRFSESSHLSQHMTLVHRTQIPKLEHAS